MAYTRLCSRRHRCPRKRAFSRIMHAAAMAECNRESIRMMIQAVLPWFLSYASVASARPPETQSFLRTAQSSIERGDPPPARPSPSLRLLFPMRRSSHSTSSDAPASKASFPKFVWLGSTWLHAPRWPRALVMTEQSNVSPQAKQKFQGACAAPNWDLIEGAASRGHQAGTPTSVRNES